MSPDNGYVNSKTSAYVMHDLDQILRVKNFQADIEPQLCSMLFDENVMVRKIALWGLYARNGDKISLLACQLLPDPHITIRYDAILILSTLYPDSPIHGINIILTAHFVDNSGNTRDESASFEEARNTMISWLLNNHPDVMNRQLPISRGIAVDNTMIEATFSGESIKSLREQFKSNEQLD